MWHKCQNVTQRGGTPNIEYGYLPVNGNKNFTIEKNAYFSAVLTYNDIIDRQHIGKIENGNLITLHGDASNSHCSANYSNGILTLSHTTGTARVAYTIIYY